MTESDGVDERILESTQIRLQQKRTRLNDEVDILNVLIKLLRNISLVETQVPNESGGYDMEMTYPNDRLLSTTMTETRRKAIYDRCLDKSEKL